MSTCTKERRLAATATCISGDAFTDALCEEHNAIALDLVERLLDEEVLRDTRFLAWRWQIVTNSIDWESIAISVRRVIALMLYNHREGQILFGRLVIINSVYIEDFETMAEEWENVNYEITGLVLRKIHEVTEYYECSDRGRRICGTIANKGHLSYMALASMCGVQNIHWTT